MTLRRCISVSFQQIVFKLSIFANFLWHSFKWYWQIFANCSQWKVEKTVKGSRFGSDRCCLTKSQRILKVFSSQIQNCDKISLLYLNLLGHWQKSKVLWFTLMLRLIVLHNVEKHAICLKYTGLQLAHMTSPQGVSAAAATTISATDRTYVALGDQGSFVRILRWMWMLRLCGVTSFRRSAMHVIYLFGHWMTCIHEASSGKESFYLEPKSRLALTNYDKESSWIIFSLGYIACQNALEIVQRIYFTQRERKPGKFQVFWYKHDIEWYKHLHSQTCSQVNHLAKCKFPRNRFSC